MSRKPLIFNLVKKIISSKKLLTGTFIFFLGYFLLIISVSIKDINESDSKAIINIGTKAVPTIILIIGVGFITYGYLEGNKGNNKIRDFKENNTPFLDEIKSNLQDLKHDQDRERTEIRQLLKKIENKFLDQKNEISFDESQTKNLFNSLKKNFSENINESFFQKMNEDIVQETLKEKRNNFEYLVRDFSSLKHRLNNEVEKLNRKANVNLVIGSLTTIVALLALSYIVFQTTTTSFENYSKLIYHYFPRLSLIIFIEVFAFFFLKLYKLNLADMKYFQNELTTVELKITAMITAINFGREKDITSITNQLSKTERNFILKKGETTVEIEKSKVDKMNYQNLLTLLNKKIKK